MTCKEKILSNDYADVIVDYIYSPEAGIAESANYCFHTVEGDLGILYIERKSVSSINIAAYGYTFLSKCYGLMQINDMMNNQMQFDPLTLINSGILPLQGEPLNLTGRGVIMGFIDTGIRYQNEAFRYSNGATRVLGIWDQTIQDGEPPKGFEYGTEYTMEQIQEALNSENPLSVVPSTDTNGHGTAVASVAAGSRVQNGMRFVGAAPDSQIVMVKVKQAKQYFRDYYLVKEGADCYQETDLLTAIQYLDSYAVSFSKPLVICIGMGTNLGDHAGTSPLASYMNIIGERKSRAMVIAGGNEGNAAHHCSAVLTETNKTQNVEIRVGEGVKGFITELWGEIPFVFSISVRSPGGEIIPKIFPRRNKREEFTFVFEKTVITVDYLLFEQNSGEELINLRFENPTPGIWTIIVYAETEVLGGRFHMWLPITDFLSAETYFLRPDPEVTLTEPSLARNVITVSTYHDKNNSFYINSGRGFASDNRIKPDIAAPGVEVSTIFGKRTGSSIAAAITAGACAQFMQWAVIEGNDPMVDSGNLRNYLIRGATRQSNISYPSREWGYGSLNLENTFRWLAGS